MSTKTLRKRIALVAVATLGAGVLSAAPAFATAIDNTHIKMDAATSGTAAIGVCVQDPAATDADSSNATAVSTKTVIEDKAKLSFTVATGTAGSVIISGPATWTAAAASQTISSDKKSVNLAAVGTLTLTAAGTGSITVTAYSAVDGGGSAVETYGITVVASCAASGPSVANTIAVISKVKNSSLDDTSVDFTADYGDVDHGSTLYIELLLRNAYKGALTSNVVLTATATNGAVIGWDVNGTASGTAAAATAVVSSLGSSTDNLALSIAKPSGLTGPLNTTVTIQANGVTVATKTVSILGVAASIAVTDVTVGTQNSTGSFKYVVKDVAGNQLTDTTVATSAIAGFTSAGVVSSATTASPGNATWIAKGTGTFACAQSKSGSQPVTIAFLNAALQAVASNTFTATCGYAAVDTFTVALDKAVYSPGEIATLTISAKDEKGGIVSDTTTVGSSIVNVAMPGMTSIGAAPTTADVFTSGKATYKFRVDQAEGSFVGQAQVDAATDLAVKTVSYSIKSSSTAVSMADVLKAIVSLIASINKQIAALQKALLKR
jgi:hypothetical protein